MRRKLLFAGAIVVLLLLAFSGGMKLGQSQVYSQLTFGSKGEILVRLPYEGTDVYVKRYKDDNIISILNYGPIDLQQEDFRTRIEERLRGLEGLEDYRWQEGELTLIKLDTARWEELIKAVLQALIPSK